MTEEQRQAALDELLWAFASEVEGKTRFSDLQSIGTDFRRRIEAVFATARNALPEPGSEEEKAALERMARSICKDDEGNPDAVFQMGLLWQIYEGPARRALRALREGRE